VKENPGLFSLKKVFNFCTDVLQMFLKKLTLAAQINMKCNQAFNCMKMQQKISLNICLVSFLQNKKPSVLHRELSAHEIRLQIASQN